jgi:anti-sigma B factor antagonist
MDISVKAMQGVTVVEMAGELTWASVPEAEPRILEAAQAGDRMILDLSRVSYMSSAGLRLLLVVYRTVADRGGRALLVGLSQDLADTMVHTGFLDFFAHRDTLEAGLAGLAS